MQKKTWRRENRVDVRREEILNVALDLATQIGYRKITRDAVADKADVSKGLVTWYFNGIEDLKRDVVKIAIEREILPILAQCLSLNDPQIESINDPLKRKVLDFLINRSF